MFNTIKLAAYAVALTVSLPSLAAPADPTACPCFTMLNAALDATSCAVEVITIRQHDQGGEYRKILAWGELMDGACTSNTLVNRSNDMSIVVHIGTATNNTGGSCSSPNTPACKVEYLTDTDVRNCNAAFRTIKREARKLPEC